MTSCARSRASSSSAAGRREAPGTQLAKVGFVAQETPTYAGLSIADHLKLGAHLNPGWDQAYARARIERLGLDLRQKAGKLCSATPTWRSSRSASKSCTSLPAATGHSRSWKPSSGSPSPRPWSASAPGGSAVQPDLTVAADPTLTCGRRRSHATVRDKDFQIPSPERSRGSRSPGSADRIERDDPARARRDRAC